MLEKEIKHNQTIKDLDNLTNEHMTKLVEEEKLVIKRTSGLAFGLGRDSLCFFIAPTEDIPLKKKETIINQAIQIAGAEAREMKRFSLEDSSQSQIVAEALFTEGEKEVRFIALLSEQALDLYFQRASLEYDRNRSFDEKYKERLLKQIKEIDEKLSALYK